MSAVALLRHWREGTIGALLLVIAALWIGNGIVVRQNGKLRTSLHEAIEMIETERAAVRNKTALARAEDAANAATVERNQIQASQEVSDDYQKQLAVLRTRYDALRMWTGAPEIDPGRNGTAAVSGLPGPSASADGAAGESRLPSADRLIASEQALRLRALQDWVRAEGEVKR